MKSIVFKIENGVKKKKTKTMKEKQANNTVSMSSNNNKAGDMIFNNKADYMNSIVFKIEKEKTEAKKEKLVNNTLKNIDSLNIDPGSSN